jgi:hypothetical protein
MLARASLTLASLPPVPLNLMSSVASRASDLAVPLKLTIALISHRDSSAHAAAAHTHHPQPVDPQQPTPQPTAPLHSPPPAAAVKTTFEAKAAEAVRATAAAVKTTFEAKAAEAVRATAAAVKTTFEAKAAEAVRATAAAAAAAAAATEPTTASTTQPTAAVVHTIPIAVLTHDRPRTLKSVVDALLGLPGMRPQLLYIFQVR